MPARMAPLANWISWMSLRVTTTSLPWPLCAAGTSTYSARRFSSRRTPGASRRSTPRESTTPASVSSATASRMPEPQMPTAGCPPMVVTCTAPSRMRTRSTAPGRGAHAVVDVGALEGRPRGARAGEDGGICRFQPAPHLLPPRGARGAIRLISVLVPMSTSTRLASGGKLCAASRQAVWSPPT